MDDNKSKALQAALAQIEKQFGKGSIMKMDGAALQQAFLELGPEPVLALLERNASPSDDDINVAMNGNICRCATYGRIRAAIHAASKTMES